MDTIRNREFGLDIQGENVSPSTVTVRDLFDVLKNLEEAIAITARETGARPDDDLNLSLVSVSDGSDELTLAVSDRMFRAAERVTNSLATGDYDRIPMRARPALWRLWKKAESTSWAFRFRPDGNGIASAEISPTFELFRPAEVSGRTVLYGKLDRFGGENRPTAGLILFSGEKVTVGLKDRDFAKQLEGYLFETIGLEGEAKWNTERWELSDFRADRLLEYTHVGVKEAFDVLAQAAGNRWDDIDPEEYVRTSRSDD